MSPMQESVIGKYNLKEEIRGFRPENSLIQVVDWLSDESREILNRDLPIRAYNPLLLPNWIIGNDSPIILVDQERVTDGVRFFDLGYEVADVPKGRFTYTVPRVNHIADTGYITQLAKDFLMATGQSRLLNGHKVIDQIFQDGDVKVVQSDLSNVANQEAVDAIALAEKEKYGISPPGYQAHSNVRM